jgi:hypothetical protein
MMQNQPSNLQTISWQALEFKPHNKNPVWFICFGILSASLILYGFYSGNLLTVATFLIISIIALFFALQNPQPVTCQLKSTGIVVNRTFYPYRNIRKFWIIYGPQNKTLNFETVAYLNSLISLQLGKQDPLAVKEYLKQYLQEDLDQQETLTDIIGRKLKF